MVGVPQAVLGGGCAASSPLKRASATGLVALGEISKYCRGDAPKACVMMGPLPHRRGRAADSSSGDVYLFEGPVHCCAETDSRSSE